MNNKSLSAASYTACFSSASCKNKYIKDSKALFFPKAVRKEINSSHCHLMSCRELPVTLLPHIPLCVKKSLYLITLHLSSHYPPHILPTHLNNLHLKNSELESVLHKQHASHKAVLSFTAPWEVIDALSVDSSSKAKAHNVRVVFQGRTVYWTFGHGKGDNIHLYKGCVSPQQWR